MAFIKGLIGCVIGGSVGGLIWALVAHFTGYEVGILATLVGALCGMGMVAGAKDSVGTTTGAVACLVALLSIAGGKVAVIHTMVQKHVASEQDQSVFGRPVDERSAPLYMAMQLVAEYESQGKALEWPPGMDPDSAEKPEDFPKDLWADATARWDSMAPEQKTTYIAGMEVVRQERLSMMVAAIDGAVFVKSFGLFDILWAFLALGAAYKIGSGNGGED